MSAFIDIFSKSLTKYGEELCGDKFKILKTEDKAIIVISDGLGSGIKAHILATLTSDIISIMLKADISFEEVVDTVLHTLPVCKIRKIAYATFTIIEVERKTNNFKVINFDNPAVFLVKNGKVQSSKTNTIEILNKKITILEGKLEKGDFLAAITDGILYAGIGLSSSFGWHWEDIARYIENLLITHSTNARNIINELSNKTSTLYKGKMGDDVTMVGLYARERSQLIMFSGPPENENLNDIYTELFFMFNGRHVVCGGTTTNIVANRLGEEVEVFLSTITNDIPPIGKLSGVDLVTEGIVTITKCIEYLKNAEGDARNLPDIINAAVILAKELLRADYIYIIVGLGINKASQIYIQTTKISVRKKLMLDLANILQESNKEVVINFC